MADQSSFEETGEVTVVLSISGLLVYLVCFVWMASCYYICKNNRRINRYRREMENNQTVSQK